MKEIHCRASVNGTSLREDSQIDFATSNIFLTLGGGGGYTRTFLKFRKDLTNQFFHAKHPVGMGGGGCLQVDVLKISKKSIFHETNVLNLAVFLSLYKQKATYI